MSLRTLIRQIAADHAAGRAPVTREAPDAVLEFSLATWNALPADVRRGLELVRLRMWTDGDTMRVQVPGYRAAEFWEKLAA